MVHDLTEEILMCSTQLSKIEEVASTDPHGFKINGLQSAVTFSGSLQPLSTEEVVQLPVGYTAEGKSKLYVPISEIELELYDRVQDHSGTYWTVYDIIDWSQHGAYKKYMLNRGLNND